MDIIGVITAFTAGVLSFLSPCVLPLVPAYIAYITGSSIDDLKSVKSSQVLKKAIFFILGFSVVFILLGLSAASLSKFIYEYKNIFDKIAGVVLIILGLSVAGVFKFGFLYSLNKRLDMSKLNSNSFLIGLAFGFGWTPCVGPVLASILVYASSMQTILQGALLLVIYSIGLALPFILVAVSIDTALLKLRTLAKYSNIVSIVSGILIVGIGILIFTGELAKLSSYIGF